MRGRKESFVFLFTKILTGIIGIISVGIQTKYIGPSALGKFSLITGFVGILVSLFASWLGSAGLRYFHVYKKTGEINSFHTTIIFDWLAMFFLIILISCIGKLIFKSIPLSEYFQYLVGILFVSSLWEIYEKLMRASDHNYAYCCILIFQSAFNIIIIILFHKITNKEIESLFWAKIITTGLSVFFVLCILSVFGNIKIRLYSMQINSIFFKYGIPMVGVWGVSWLLNYSDRYIINYFLSSSEVGLYDVAYRFSESSIGMIMSAFNLAFFPAMIKTWNDEGREATCDMIRNVFRYLLMFSIPAFIGLTLLSNRFYGTIIDKQYSEASIVMSIASVGFIFMGVNNTLYKLWQLEEKTNVVLYLTMVSVAFNIITNIIFIPLFGYIAAALTTVVSYLIITIIASIIVKKRFDIKIDFISLSKQILSGIIMGVFIILFRRIISNTGILILCIILSASIYFVSLLLMGELAEEISDIKKKLLKK